MKIHKGTKATQVKYQAFIGAGANPIRIPLTKEIIIDFLSEIIGIN
jgi:hypothetical protein